MQMDNELVRMPLRDLWHSTDSVPSDLAEKNAVALDAYAERLRIAGGMKNQLERSERLLKGLLVRRKLMIRLHKKDDQLRKKV